MTKRSAMTIAGGLVAALLAGVVALSINLGIMRTAGASGPGKLTGAPIVKTIVETVKDAPVTPVSAPTTVIVRKAKPATTTVTASHSDDESEHEYGENDDD